MNKQKFIRVIAMSVVLGGLVSCSKDKDSSPIIPAISVQVANNPTLGKILTDSAGYTLYFFSVDANGKSACSGGCSGTWPAFFKENPTFSTELTSTDFDTITRTDGSKQTTYKGWPLYYYKPDTRQGDVNGEAINGVWFVAKPDYTVMLAKTQLVGNDSVQYNSQYQPGAESVVYLTDDLGRTLYAFSPDHFNANHYTKADFSNNNFWPIFERSAVEGVPSILSKADFSTTGVFGKTQLTYKGWPLYNFGPDNQTRGNTKGVSVPAPGVWPVVNNTSTVAPQ